MYGDYCMYDQADNLRELDNSELQEYEEFLWKKHEEAHEARSAMGSQYKTDTDIDELMKDTLDRLRKVEKEERKRGLID